MTLSWRALAIALVAAASVSVGAAQPAPAPKPPFGADIESDAKENTAAGLLAFSLDKVREAALALPVATALGAALALRPRRRGTPKRSAPIVQTQIILAVIGSLVMLVVGTSLARAFGVVGAAGLVRYRAKVQDPKDAGVMLSTLAIGLASGVGLHLLAAFATLFILGALWVIESFEPAAQKVFELTVTTKDAKAIQPQIETLLRRQKAAFELRSSSETAMAYQVHMPMNRGTDGVTKAILELPGATAVDWNEDKKKEPDGH